ncbi:uncharacterized protein LOC124435269 [Xenia sp. Carnegie-2017]|uniref:uncharacterized protein LOC124435269 n=1 Tax=Xenia sp. Carnegie-2017 TaxID=2897299 RepID=UPI001F036363|nr:uncharacterized protein LOC124435269 [Xenia sp. Carnegie-2017]
MEIVRGMRDDSHDSVDSSHMIKNGVCEKENDIHVMSDEEEVMLPTDKMLISKSTGTRNAMGEFIPGDGEKPFTELSLPSPGPSSYSLRVGLTKPMVPSYSIVGRGKDELSELRQSVYLGNLSPGPKYDTSDDVVWKRKTCSLKSKLETSPYRPHHSDHLTCSLGSAAYKVDYYETGRHAPKCTIATRFSEPVIPGPPNSAIEPVDTKGFSTPGPSYFPSSSQAMEKSFGLKCNIAVDNGVPGPGKYTIEKKNSGSQYSFGRKVSHRSRMSFC